MNDAPHIENFEIVGLLGRGGMATVWKARQSSLDRFVAVKVLSSSFATDPADIARFRDEARAAGRLKHPGIVQVYDANFTNGSFYFVMELVDGYTVGEWIRRKGLLDEKDVLTVAESVIAALDYAWTNFGIIHCDIKPENVMVDADGSVKTTDLGLARAIVSMQSKEQELEVLGTPAYMSPEQVSGQPDLDCRADIYALGASMYHMATGHTLFAGEGTEEEIMQRQLANTVQSPSKEVPGLSHGFVLLLAKMLAKDRKYRPSDWKAVMADIRRVREHRTPGGHEPPPGASTIFIEANESDAVRRQALQAAAVRAVASDNNDSAAWMARLALWSFLLLAICFGLWWLLLGGAGQIKAAASAAQVAGANDTQYQNALAYAVANPADLTGGIARLDEVLARAPASRYAPQARAQRESRSLELQVALQTICQNLETQAHELVAQRRSEDALQMLEKYQGAYAAETMAWRLEQATLIRAQVTSAAASAAAPAPAELVTSVPAAVATPVPDPAPVVRSSPHQHNMTEAEGVMKVARALLKSDLELASRRAEEIARKHEEWPSEGKFAALRKVLTQAQATEQAVRETFTAEHGKMISVALRAGPVKGTVGEISGEHVHLTLVNGADRTFTLDELEASERLRRLKDTHDSGAGATLLKAVWAYHAHAVDHAKTLFASLPEPVGMLFARVLEERP